MSDKEIMYPENDDILYYSNIERIGVFCYELNITKQINPGGVPTSKIKEKPKITRTLIGASEYARKNYGIRLDCACINGPSRFHFALEKLGKIKKTLDLLVSKA